MWGSLKEHLALGSSLSIVSMAFPKECSSPRPFAPSTKAGLYSAWPSSLPAA